MQSPITQEVEGKVTTSHKNGPQVDFDLNVQKGQGYGLVASSHSVLLSLLQKCGSVVPKPFRDYAESVIYSAPTRDGPCFPCPLKEQETGMALKALEGSAAAAIADLRYGQQKRVITVDADQAWRFLMSCYLVTVDGRDKMHPEVKAYIPDTDLNQAQSILYRRVSAGLYETRNPGEYFHIHGSLDASTSLNMIGLPAFDENLTEYGDCIAALERAVKRFSASELDALNVQNHQAGFTALEWDDFVASDHGRALLELPPFTAEQIEQSTPPVPFPTGAPGSSPQCLQGIRVLELCRVIAGPVIGRSLAAHGASVLKVTSPGLPDVPFFQLDVNVGKHTTALDLKRDEDRQVFEALLKTADVLIDGYSPGALARLGYGAERLASLGRQRGRGYVYVAEDCFGQVPLPGGGGGTSQWSGRRGWQQIADCATGVAWMQGRFMGLSEPVVPPFPISDYGTGALGCLAAMVGLYRRAMEGGSWECRTSLCQYDAFVASLGLLPPEAQAELRRRHTDDFFRLRHGDSVDEIGKRALASMKHAFPALFGREDSTMQKVLCPGFGPRASGAEVQWPKEAVEVTGLSVRHLLPPRPNGFDHPSWEDLEEDIDKNLLD